MKTIGQTVEVGLGHLHLGTEELVPGLAIFGGKLRKGKESERKEKKGESTNQPIVCDKTRNNK